MEFFVKNDTNRPKALRSAVNGEMVIVPPRSEGVYDLAETGHPNVPGLYIGPIPDAVEEAPAPKKSQVAPKKAPVAAPKPAPAPEPSPAAPAVTEAGPAPWQKGLAGQ